MSKEFKQMRRQSKDFKEIWNIHTSLNVGQEQWDSIFHNWEDPKNCVSNKKVAGCKVCDTLKAHGFAIKPSGTIYAVNIAIIGDAHANYEGINYLIDNDPSLAAIISVGDLALWTSEEEASKDKKGYKYTKENVKKYIQNRNPFRIPIYAAKGNHDDYNNMHSTWFTDMNIHYMQQAEVLKINNLKIGFLGGIYSSTKTFGDSDKFVGRDNRFYTIDEINLLKNSDIDLLVTHQAAKEVLPDEIKQEGSKELQDLLDNILPEYYAHGHHHKNYKTTYKDTKVFGLGNFSFNPTAYVVINTLTNEVK